MDTRSGKGWPTVRISMAMLGESMDGSDQFMNMGFKYAPVRANREHWSEKLEAALGAADVFRSKSEKQEIWGQEPRTSLRRKGLARGNRLGLESTGLGAWSEAFSTSEGSAEAESAENDGNFGGEGRRLDFATSSDSASSFNDDDVGV